MNAYLVFMQVCAVIAVGLLFCALVSYLIDLYKSRAYRGKHLK